MSASFSDEPVPRVPLTPALARLSALIDEMDAVRREASRSYAAQMDLFAGLVPVVEARRAERAAAESNPRRQHVWLAEREVIADAAAAWRVSENTIHSRMARARQITTVFPAVHRALQQARIDPAQADAICEVGVVLDSTDVADTVRAEYAAEAVAAAQDETPARLRGILTALVSRLVPERVEEQVVDAAAQKCMRAFDLSPGLARLQIDGPTAEIHGIFDRATRQAHVIMQTNADAAARADAARDAGQLPDGEDDLVDERTFEQIRADVAIDELLTGAPTAHGRTDEGREQLARIRGVVTVTIPASTLAGATTGGGMIPGHGPVDDETAKRIAAVAPVWTRVFTDPVTDIPVHVDRYKPSKAQRRFLTARDEHCRFFGCRRPAATCHLDHNVRHKDGGPTALWNLAHFCAGHHIVKHHTDWRMQQIDGGVIVWTSPTGRTYVDRPPGTPRITRPARPNRVWFDDEPDPPRHPLLGPRPTPDDPGF